MYKTWSVGISIIHFLFNCSRNSLSVIVVNFSPLAFICKPLSEVKSIGFSFLNFKATVRIWLSAELFLKSFGNNDMSDISILKSLVSKRLFIDFKAFCTFLLLALSSFDFKVCSLLHLSTIGLLHYPTQTTQYDLVRNQPNLIVL